MGGGNPLLLIAGPCVIESESHAVGLAIASRDIARRAGVPYVFKASYDKANRTSGRSFRGPGIEEGLRVLARVRDAAGVPILTDIHEPAQAARAAEVADVLHEEPVEEEKGGNGELGGDETFACSECGEDVPADADVCPNCGARFDE